MMTGIRRATQRLITARCGRLAAILALLAVFLNFPGLAPVQPVSADVQGGDTCPGAKLSFPFPAAGINPATGRVVYPTMGWIYLDPAPHRSPFSVAAPKDPSFWHSGLDIWPNYEGAVVRALADGYVTRSQQSSTNAAGQVIPGWIDIFYPSADVEVFFGDLVNVTPKNPHMYSDMGDNHVSAGEGVAQIDGDGHVHVSIGTKVGYFDQTRIHAPADFPSDDPLPASDWQNQLVVQDPTPFFGTTSLNSDFGRKAQSVLAGTTPYDDRSKDSTAPLTTYWQKTLDSWCKAGNPPAAPSNLKHGPVTNATIPLAWDDYANNEAGAVLTNGADYLRLPPNTPSYTVTGLYQYAQRCFAMVAFNAWGFSPWSPWECATTDGAPASPTSLYIAYTSSSVMQLVWINHDSNAKGYSIFDGLTFTNVPPGTTYYTMSGLPANSLRCFAVYAYNDYGFSPAATPWACGVTLSNTPASPTNMRVTGKTSSSISLAWDDNATNETGYTLYDGVNKINLGPNTTSYTVTGLPGSSYRCYAVNSYNGYGSSPAYSNWACATTAPATGTVTGVVTNASNGQPIAGASVSIGGVSGTTNSAGNFSISNVPSGSQYLQTAVSGFVTRTDPVTVPAGSSINVTVSLVPVAAAGNITIVLSWGAAPSDLDAHLTGPDVVNGGRFEVYYHNPNAVPYASLDHDARAGYGPETVTIRPYSATNQFVPGSYSYFVNNYSHVNTGDVGFGGSGATVTVSQGGVQTRQFQVGSASGDPNAPNWSVFTFTLAADGTMTISAVNTFTSIAPSTAGTQGTTTLPPKPAIGTAGSKPATGTPKTP